MEQKSEVGSKEYVRVDLITILIDFFSFFRKNILIYVIAFVASLALSFLYIGLYPNKYKARMIAYTQQLSFEEAEGILSNLNDVLLSKDYEQAASLLGISENSVKKISKISSERLISKESLKAMGKSDISVEKMIITAVVTDYAIFDTLNYSLGYFMSNNSYNKLKNESLDYGFKSTYDKAMHELSILDSMKIEEVLFNKSNKEGMVTLNPAEFRKSILDIYGIALSAKNSLELTECFTVIDGFKQSKSPINKNINTFVLFSFIFSLFFGSIFVLVKQRL